MAGFIQGGGFGSLSKQFGTGAANLLEAEVVTADGRILVANEHQEPELFWALRGGGGGAFGVVTRLTLRSHPLPRTVGVVQFDVTAASQRAWRALVGAFIEFYASSLHNPAWGEQARFGPGRRLGVSMIAHGLEEANLQAIWRPFLDWVRADRELRISDDARILAIPGRLFWNPAFLKTVTGAVIQDDRPGAPDDNIFWATNQGEVGQVIEAYQSLWLPERLLRPSERGQLADALMEAAAIWPVGLHFNKGLSGGSRTALERTARTSTHPAALDAFALLICAAGAGPTWPGVPGHEPDVARARANGRRVSDAMEPVRRLAPEAGSYLYEADYFQRDWKRTFWGDNYARLAAIKRDYDPANLFRGRFSIEPE